jgi:tetratricopeptide (TPR) repeat protein
MNRIRLLLCLGCALILGSCAVKPANEPPPSPPVKVVKPAEKTAEKTVEKADLGCAYFYFLWASHAEYYQRFDEALEAYEKAVICDPDAAYAQKKIPLILIKQGENAKAAVWLQQAIKENPRDSSLYLLLAHLKILENKGKEAIKLYNEALKYAPDNQVILLRLGLLYTDQKKYRLAEIIFRNLLRTNDKLYLAHVYLARLLIQISDFTGAGQEYERALQLNWNQELAYEMADFYVKHEQYDKAVNLYTSIIEADDTDERAVLNLAQTHLVMGKEQEAIEELRHLRTLSENPDKIDLVIARILLRTDKTEESRELLEKVADEFGSAEARYILALIAVQEKDGEKALAYLEKITPADVEFEEAIYLQVRILRESDRIGKAKNLLKRSIADSARRRPLFYALLASLYEEEGDQDKALGLLKTGIDLYSDNEQLHFAYAIILDKKGRQDEAIAVMEKVLELFPDHPEALNYIGYTWADRNMKLDTALKYIKKAVELKPDNGYILDSLGWVYYRLGRLTEARDELEKALKLTADDANIHDHLGDVYRALRDFDKARKAYRKAIELFSEQEKKAAVEKKINDLEANATH